MGTIALVAAAAAIGCVKPAERFDEFGNRVIDASNVRIDAPVLDMIPDITGEFFLALRPSIAPEDEILFIAAVDFTDNGDGTAVADFTFTALCHPSRAAQGQCTGGAREEEGTPIEVTAVPIANTGEFEADISNKTIPAAANPLRNESIQASITLEGAIQSTDLFCGRVSGRVVVDIPVSLDADNSPFAAIRVADGTRGDALPGASVDCSGELLPDAGPVPDAAIDGGI